jgi:NADH dehydrogenase
MQLLPGRPPVTSDQVQMLKTDNVCSGELPGFDALGIAPSAMEAEVPRYLGFRAQADAA